MATFHSFPYYEMPGFTKEQNAVWARTLWEIKDPGTSGTGVGEFDCLVDSTLTASTPIASAGTGTPQYKGISEALNDFSANGRERCWALIREDGSGGTTYDERTTAISIGNLHNIRLFGQTSDSNDDTNQAIIWQPKTNLTVSGTGARLAIENLTIDWVGAAIGGLTVDVLIMLGVTLLWEGGGNSVTQSVTASYLYARHCTFGSNSGASSNITMSATKATYIGCEAYNSANDGKISFTTDGHGYAEVAHGTSTPGGGGATDYIEFAGAGSWIAHTRYASAFRGISIAGARGDIYLSGTGTISLFPITGDTLTLNSTGLYIVHGTVNDLVVSAACDIEYTGMVNRLINMTVTTAKGCVRASCNQSAIFKGGPWAVDLGRPSPTNGGKAFYLQIAGSVANSTFRVSGNSSAAVGEKPYDILAGATLTILDFAGATTYPAGGADAGTGSLIRVT